MSGESAVRNHDGSLGIMVFSSTCQVLYANQAAYHFIERLNRQENGQAPIGALPVSIADLFHEMLTSLERRSMDQDQQQLEARRWVLGQGSPLMLQAFGLPDRLKTQHLRVVITMQGTRCSLDASHQEASPSLPSFFSSP